MKWIGLTGCIGCGKSTVAQILKQQYQCEVISADEVSHNVMLSDSAVHSEILKRWDLDFYKMPFLDYRQMIARKVFGQPEELKFLEELMHPRIKTKVAKIKENLSKDHTFAFYDVPLLFEKNMQKQFDFIVGVFASESTQKQRISERNTWSDEEIQKRLGAQMSVEEKIPQCDFVISNDGSLSELENQVKELYEKIKALD